MTTQLTVNGNRLWQSLMDLAELGATPAGGCNRQALTDLDRQARDLFIQWCTDAGCSIKIDTMGNIFAQRPGRNNNLPPVVTGSHIDTQPTGGKFDGVYGVLAGLEVIRSLNDHGIETEAPIEASVWTNEEGARFSPAMIGSGVWCGEFDVQYGHSRADKSGKTIGEELARINYLGDIPCEPRPIKGFIEVHIEQGPILEAEALQIGVVEGVQGIYWYDLTLHGTPVHAGPTPMNVRHDPFMVLPDIINELYQLIEQYGPDSRITFGDIKAEPGARNTVPEKITLAVDIRHPRQAILDELDAKFREIVNNHCEKKLFNYNIRDEWRSPAVQFSKTCVDAISNATQNLGLTHKHMFSGAGHDSVYISRKAPTAMIFIPCKDGISHNEAEYATPEDIEAGANVLLNTMVSLANS